jgi:NADPH:quinone reductase-like Zn-dependent oxidoreductase
MKAIRVHARGGLESLRFEDAPTPRPGPGEMLVRVRAAAVTPTELLWAPTWTTRDGGARPLPVIPGHEFSGDVAALGEGVTAVGVGEPVYGMNDWFGDGAQAEYCLARPADVARKPASIDHAHAAVTPISDLTAWQGLFERARLAAGQQVLIHGAAGGVGSLAVQLAARAGATVIAPALPEDVPYLHDLGVTDVLPRDGDLVADVRERYPDGVDALLDLVSYAPGSYDATLKTDARIASPLGAAGEGAGRTNVMAVPSTENLQRLSALIADGSLRVPIQATYTLAQAPEALAARATTHSQGKIAIQIV